MYNRLVAADYHYKNRSPRNQDLETIQSLQNELTDNMNMIAKLKVCHALLWYVWFNY